MRLIDADALKEKLSDFEVRGGHKYYRQGMDVCLHECFPAIIDDRPTIDPENLSIVQQLRAELAEIKAERAELADFELSVCEHLCTGDSGQNIPRCEWLVDGKCKLLEWRSPQEV